jgi:hypothetical protein
MVKEQSAISKTNYPQIAQIPLIFKIIKGKTRRRGLMPLVSNPCRLRNLRIVPLPRR